MSRISVVILLTALAGLAGVSGCAEKANPCLRIDPQADAALHKMSATLSHAKSFSFQSMTTMDEPVETGQLVQFSRQIRVVAQRPDRLFVQTQMGNDAWTLWYEGTSLTLLDKVGKAYASAKVPGRIGAMLDTVAREHDLTVPLSDFLFADPYEVLTTGALTGKYIGQFEMAGAKCDQLLFTHDALDWQIWIDAGGQAVPRKIVIDYKRMPERPQFTAVFSDWNLAAPAEAAQFTPQLPKETKRVELDELLAGVEGE
jgi:hypothetical protein